jgi:hypothetical protein
MTLYRFIFCLVLLASGLARAEDAAPCPSASARDCITTHMLKDAEGIYDTAWRDQAYRDLAGSLTYDKKIDQAIALVEKIQNPDTQAMTIRAIGMAAALYGKDSPQQMKITFMKLKKASDVIRDTSAHAIAETYIAMAQAFAGLDDDAWVTASAMKNTALKHKAYGETAEIQAERGDIDKAMASITKIETASFRNKAYQTVAEILIKKQMFDQALKAASGIDNPTKRVDVMQDILHAQEELTRGPRNDAAKDMAKIEADAQ